MEATAAIVLRLVDAAAVLKRLPRAGWLVAGVPVAESVAEHSYATAIMALALGEAINRDLSGQGLAQALDLGLVAQIALAHDLAESRVTDLPHGATYYLGSDAKAQAEAAAIRDVCGMDAPEPGSPGLLRHWQAYAEQSSAEARLVRDADKLEMVAQALVYARAGHRGLDEFWQGHTWRFPLSAAVFAELSAARSAL